MMHAREAIFERSNYYDLVILRVVVYALPSMVALL